MDDVLECPICGQSNPADQEICQYCGGRLVPPDSKSAQPGQEAAGNETSAGNNNIPDSVDSDQLEGSPTWKDSTQPELPPEPATGASAESPSDWLSGLGKASAEEDEEIPDWLADLQGGKAETASTPPPGSEPGTPESEIPFEEVDRLADLSQPDSGSLAAGQEPEDQQFAPADQIPQESVPLEGLPDWLKSLESEAEAKGGPDASLSEVDERSGLPDLSGIPGAADNEGEGEPGSLPNEATEPDWLADLPGIPEIGTPVEESIENATPSEKVLDWQDQGIEKPIGIGPSTEDTKSTAPKENEVPDWLAAGGAVPETAATTPANEIPDWLADLEAKSGPVSGDSDALSGSEPPSPDETSIDIPDWLSQFPAGSGTAVASGLTSEPGSATQSPEDKPESKPLPDWLADTRSDLEPVENKPAFTTDEESVSVNKENEPALPVETPDWLSKITPEQASQNPPPTAAETPVPSNQDVSNLPSWVQAMRPLESVVSEAQAAPQATQAATEHSGPLAGLTGVLPVDPGLGQLSKPPAYSVKLQATEGQQRYAAALDRLVSSESKPREIKVARITTSSVWRWLISIFLIIAILLPLIGISPTTPPSQLKPPEMIDAFSVIGLLNPNSAVLVVFDYDPAFSGELEAAAAPLMDHILFQGPRLTLISTSPTGPALAERYFHDARVSPLIVAHNYQSGQQYVNLGYLAGGPSGIQLFAMSPSMAAPLTLDGSPAWQLPPLQGIQKLSDFSAILVLTDNADTGRAWVEQTGTSIGNTPMLMVISAQAEPLLLPYYDSGQIKGLITGLVGGEYYAQTFLRPDGQTEPVQHYWNSFSFAILTVEILIVIGALGSLISDLRARRIKGSKGV